MKNKIKHASSIGYTVDKFGNVFSPKGKRRKLDIKKTNYLRFSTRFNGKTVSNEVHRLQAYQKYGDRIFEDGVQVRHLNGNSLDNSWNNISIGTASENAMDRGKKERTLQATNAGRSKSPLTEEDVLEIRERVRSGDYITYQKLAEEYNLKSKGTISDIVNRKIWKQIYADVA